MTWYPTQEDIFTTVEAHFIHVCNLATVLKVSLAFSDMGIKYFTYLLDFTLFHSVGYQPRSLFVNINVVSVFLYVLVTFPSQQVLCHVL